MSSNEYPTTSAPTELSPTAFGCTPRGTDESTDDLLQQLIARLDELTRPATPGRLS